MLFYLEQPIEKEILNVLIKIRFKKNAFQQKGAKLRSSIQNW